MRRSWLAAIGLLGVAVAVIADTSPELQLPVTRAVLFGAGVIVAVIVLRRTAAMTASAPERFDAALRVSPTPPPEIDAFRRIEFSLRMATVHPLGIEWLRPILRDLATWKLLRVRGLDMRLDPDAARRVLGEPLWRLAGPAAGNAAATSGVTLAELDASLDRIDRL